MCLEELAHGLNQLWRAFWRATSWHEASLFRGGDGVQLGSNGIETDTAALVEPTLPSSACGARGCRGASRSACSSASVSGSSAQHRQVRPLRCRTPTDVAEPVGEHAGANAQGCDHGSSPTGTGCNSNQSVASKSQCLGHHGSIV